MCLLTSVLSNKIEKNVYCHFYRILQNELLSTFCRGPTQLYWIPPQLPYSVALLVSFHSFKSYSKCSFIVCPRLSKFRHTNCPILSFSKTILYSRPEQFHRIPNNSILFQNKSTQFHKQSEHLWRRCTVCMVRACASFHQLSWKSSQLTMENVSSP